MKVPLSWLKKYVTLPENVEKIAKTLTFAGLEVEEIAIPKATFSNVVVAEVKKAEKHPNADKLKIATVFDGTEEVEVVCGAPNCEVGIRVPLAKVGATLEDEEGKSWKIKKGKLRGIESNGMLCSEKELKLGDDTSGLMQLDAGIPLGTPVETLYNDPIFDISLTPNLGHCMSVRGIARELAANLDLKMHAPSYSLKESNRSIKEVVEIKIDKVGCTRYGARLIEGVKIAPSPKWLEELLTSVGMKSINNAVDVTNYVLYAMGQPLHAFDFDQIEGHTISAKCAEKECTVKTLDGETRVVPQESVLIYDGKKPVAIGGIMGLENSMVTEKTHTILLEAAHFSPEKIRKTSKALKLKTDASNRFDKGVDISAIEEALDFAAALIQELCDATVLKGRLLVEKENPKRRTIALREERVSRILGIHFSRSEITSLLQKLDIHCVKEDENLTFSIPFYRNDLTIEMDLIEEIARLYGYNHFPKTFSKHHSATLLNAPLYEFEKKMRTLLLREGLQEVLTCNLISPVEAGRALENSFPKSALATVLYPSSIDQSVLRPSLLPGLLNIVKYNSDRRQKSVRAFEVGKIHFKDKENFKEQIACGIILWGEKDPVHFSEKTKSDDFFDLKGIIENCLDGVHISNISVRPSHMHTLHPKRQAHVFIEEILVGVIGEVHPRIGAEMEIPGRLYFAQLDLSELFPLTRTKLQYKPIPTFPGMERDWTVTLSENEPIGNIIDAMKKYSSPLLEKILVLDLYKSEQIGKDKRNMTFRFLYRDRERTLLQEVVDQEHERLKGKMEAMFNL